MRIVVSVTAIRVGFAEQLLSLMIVAIVEKMHLLVVASWD